MNHEGQPCRAELSRLLRAHTSDVAEDGKGRGAQELWGFPGVHGQAHPGNPASEADTQVFHRQLRLSPPDSQSPRSPSCFPHCQGAHCTGGLCLGESAPGAQKLRRHGTQPGTAAFD